MEKIKRLKIDDVCFLENRVVYGEEPPVIGGELSPKLIEPYNGKQKNEWKNMRNYLKKGIGDLESPNKDKIVSILDEASKYTKWGSREKNADTNKYVYAMQVALHSLGYNPGKIDSVWGSATHKALKAFQAKEMKVSGNGFPGPKTLTALKEAFGSSVKDATNEEVGNLLHGNSENPFVIPTSIPASEMIEDEDNVLLLKKFEEYNEKKSEVQKKWGHRKAWQDIVSSLSIGIQISDTQSSGKIDASLAKINQFIFSMEDLDSRIQQAIENCNGKKNDCKNLLNQINADINQYDAIAQKLSLVAYDQFNKNTGNIMTILNNDKSNLDENDILKLQAFSKLLDQDKTKLAKQNASAPAPQSAVLGSDSNGTIPEVKSKTPQEITKLFLHSKISIVFEDNMYYPKVVVGQKVIKVDMPLGDVRMTPEALRSALQSREGEILKQAEFLGIEKINSPWISKKQDLRSNFPRFFDSKKMKEDCQYRLINNDNDILVAEYDTEKNGLPDGVVFVQGENIIRNKNPIKDGEIVASMDYGNADRALSTLEEYNLLTQEEGKKLSDLLKKYPKKQDRDFNFYKAVAEIIVIGWEAQDQIKYLFDSVKKFDEVIAKNSSYEKKSVDEIKKYIGYDQLINLPANSRLKTTDQFPRIINNKKYNSYDIFITQVNEFFAKRALQQNAIQNGDSNAPAPAPQLAETKDQKPQSSVGTGVELKSKTPQQIAESIGAHTQNKDITVVFDNGKFYPKVKLNTGEEVIVNNIELGHGTDGVEAIKNKFNQIDSADLMRKTLLINTTNLTNSL